MIENDIHGRQTLAYKVMRYLNSNERDTAKLDIIQEKEWIEHYKNLWYDPQLEQETNEKYECYNFDLVTINELEKVLKKSKGRKAPGPDGISTELIKYGGTLLKLRFLHLLNLCWKLCKIPKEWTKAKVISLFKKGNRRHCNNYRGISLLNAGYKIYTKIINKRLTDISDVLLLEEQNGFRTERSCMDDIIIIKQVIEKRREYNLETHVAFIDYEKAFDRANRNKLWQILKRRGYPLHRIQVYSKCMQFKIKLQNTGSVGLHIYREWTIPDFPNKLFYTNQGEEDMWVVLGRDGQPMSEQETLLYLEVMMMMMNLIAHF
jgi:hypothetical protein